MSCVRTYAPSEVSLTIALLYDVKDFSEDSMININKDTDYFSTNVGAAGGVERTHIPNDVYTLEISLSQTSPTNTILSSMASIDQLSRLVVFPIFAKDSSGSSLFLATSCWIESPPDVPYSSSLEDRVWRIKCSEMVFNVGGNGTDDEGIDNDIARLASLGSSLAGLF